MWSAFCLYCECSYGRSSPYQTATLRFNNGAQLAALHIPLQHGSRQTSAPITPVRKAILHSSAGPERTESRKAAKPPVVLVLNARMG